MPSVVKPKSKKSRQPKAPVCVGSGFVALDLVFEGDEQVHPSFTFAGGSCGNVLTILAFLEWDSIPVIRLKNDAEAKKLVADLERWKVDTRFVRTEPTGSTPIVVQRICTPINGDPFHRFEWKCPNTGLWLPRYRPLPQRLALEVSSQLPKPQVFYFDRAEKSSCILAKQAREEGALVCFEPSSATEDEVFKECIDLSDVVKYSAERFTKLPRTKGKGPLLEIQTLGREGLKYRVFKSGRAWKHMPAIPASHFKDAAGAGDWCSAGILNILGRNGRKGFQAASSKKVEEALRFGQVLATINCGYAGARGCMYHLKRKAVLRQTQTLLETDEKLAA